MFFLLDLGHVEAVVFKSLYISNFFGTFYLHQHVYRFHGMDRYFKYFAMVNVDLCYDDDRRNVDHHNSIYI